MAALARHSQWFFPKTAASTTARRIVGHADGAACHRIAVESVLRLGTDAKHAALRQEGPMEKPRFVAPAYVTAQPLGVDESCTGNKERQAVSSCRRNSVCVSELGRSCVRRHHSRRSPRAIDASIVRDIHCQALLRQRDASQGGGAGPVKAVLRNPKPAGQIALEKGAREA
eukprot:scaffold172_cov254-Pinguiococcus_pyrenoidosus.AAC.35